MGKMNEPDVQQLAKAIAAALDGRERHMVEEIALNVARAAMRLWDEKQRHADERLFGWKAISEEVSTVRGQPTPERTLQRWWSQGRRMPIDRDRGGQVSAVRWELQRWFRQTPHHPKNRR